MSVVTADEQRPQDSVGRATACGVATPVRPRWRGWPASDSIGVPGHPTWGYSRTEIIEVARSFPVGHADLVVRVPSCDFAAIGAALDAGARAVIVPQIESAAEAEGAVAATFYPRSAHEVGASSAGCGTVRRSR
mgnify:CR=1 FL=1